MIVKKIISGGQTGADQGALYAAEDLAIATGGSMPNGFRTETGANPALAARFGLVAHTFSDYSGRTWSNVAEANATLIFGNTFSAGSRITKRYATMSGKPLYQRRWPAQDYREDDPAFRLWLANNQIAILNVAGNRASVNPGIFDAVRSYLVTNLTRED